MNKQDENKLVMMKALLSFLKQNQAIWQNLQPFVAAVNELENSIAAIEAIRQSTDVDQSGLVTEKKTLRTNLANRSFEVASQIYAMACKTKDMVLQAKVNFPKSELEGQRDGELASTSKTIVGLGWTYLQALIPYGITDVELNSLSALILAYENSLPTARISVSERKANNEKLKGLFVSSKLILKDQINRMMVRYQSSNPDFYAGYLSASKVVDYGIRHEKPLAPETPA
ncbi:MAG TPA: hypothetical protein DHV48_00300 [Prolixibacteraceae bacterium]|nr:hypothetical protein [Prolixibacteraceae bacterium]